MLDKIDLILQSAVNDLNHKVVMALVLMGQNLATLFLCLDIERLKIFLLAILALPGQVRVGIFLKLDWEQQFLEEISIAYDAAWPQICLQWGH
jgi:hypothetical protein